jgi:hypothetical protein
MRRFAARGCRPAALLPDFAEERRAPSASAFSRLGLAFGLGLADPLRQAEALAHRLRGFAGDTRGLREEHAMRRRVLIGFAAALWLAAPATANENEASARRAGEATKEAAREVGHASRDAAKSVGHATRDVFREIGHAFRRLGKKLSD